MNKALSFYNETMEKLAREIIDAQIAKTAFNASSSNERIKDALGIMNFLGLSYQIVTPFGVIIDGKEFRGWITDHKNYRYEIIDSQEFCKRMEVSKSTIKSIVTP